MSEFKSQRLSYTWKGEWSSGTEYQRDDVVGLNGKSYVCLIQHTSSSVFSEDLNAVLPNSDPPQPQPRWVLMTQGRSYRGTWQSGEEYNLGEIVYYKGSVWVCSTAHVSSVFSQDRDNWQFFAQHIEYLGNWESGTDYAEGSLVKYNGTVYKCVAAHASQGNLEDDDAKWSVFHSGVEYRGTWQGGTEYRKSDVVKYGASLYRCTETHTSVPTSTETDPTTGEDSTVIGFDTQKFQVEYPGFQYEESWDPEKLYQAGDIVRYGGILWYALRANTDSDPFQLPDDSTIDWIEFSNSYNFQGDWSLGAEYRKGDVVQRGGNVYVALRDVGRNDGAGSVSDYLDPDWWELLIPSKVFAGTWCTGEYYSVGDIVYHLGSAYTCTFEHTADNTNFPGDNGNIYDYWDLLVEAGRQGGLQAQGDLVSYGLDRTIVGDGSSLGPVSVPIGTHEQMLSVTREQEVFWRLRANDSRVVWVSEIGVDNTRLDSERGLVPHKPFRTIRFASEYVQDNFEPGELVTINVSTGTFEEIGPVVVPAGCALFGDELRSTTIEPNKPLPEYQDDYQYAKDYLSYITTFIFLALSNQEVEPSPLNDVESKTVSTPASLEGINLILGLISEFETYVEAALAESLLPVTTGTNNLSENTDRLDAAQAIRENQEFIETELWAYVQSKYSKNFDRLRIANDVASLLRGIRRDLEYTGNYGTHIAAERYARSILGSERRDLFYVRDTTGLRNFTLKGMKGELENPVEGNRYRRPTGGAYITLDPGWGPADERTWIKKRSPYIQGVTSIGTGCVGKRVDGRTHNGGNRSMTSNDFTNVLSDGIGIWASDGGRTEAVSVFTYYNTVGYLSERGGIIRSTNGNNSYGRFGSIADGNDPSETPQNVTVFNRNNEAQVDTALAGGLIDELLAFEYTNAGEQYTQASAEIVGAGDFAGVEYSEFRNGALFEQRVINTTGSGQPGGAGYLVRQGFAQETLDSSDKIKLASSDDNNIDTVYIGQRILLIAGEATGQYAYIDSYNPPNKVATVRRESDDQPGWDHVVPGTPIANSLDTTTQYRIEPRITVTSPGFTSQTQSYAYTPQSVKGLRYGTTTAVFEDVELPDGSGSLEGIPAVPAVLKITRTGQTYSAEITDPGAGYSAMDKFVIPGTDLDGALPDNDLEITVTQVTEDSTNSIVDFGLRGTGRGGRFVAVSDNKSYYSDDAETWLETDLPFDSAIVTDLIAADNQFLAIAENKDLIARSLDGATWTTQNLPRSEKWSSVAYGKGVWCIISSDSDFVAYSTDAQNWNITEIPEDTESASQADSTLSSYVDLVYAKGQFVAISNSDRATATSEDGITWIRNDTSLPDKGTGYVYEIVGLQHGDNKYAAVAEDGVVVYSFDAVSWYETETISLGTDEKVVDFRYAQGLFVAVIGSDSITTNKLAITEDLLKWRTEIIDTMDTWRKYECGFDGEQNKYIVLADNSNSVNIIRTGKQAKLRADVFQGQVSTVKIWDPGSGYTSTNPPVIDIIDSSYTVAAETESRLGNGVLAQPDFVNRGNGYRTSTSEITVTGDGYADIIPEDDTIVLAGVSTLPGIGAQIRIEGISEDNSEKLTLFNVAKVRNLGDDGSGMNTLLVELVIGPDIENEDNLRHGTPATIRIIYSQVRITNHDFLDIGTGNFEETQYPALYAGGAYFVASPEQETLEENGGRVFFVSTDQDGNFRAGDLFAVEQATGIVTISADFFDFTGLSELALGGIRLGGSGTVVREFSTDSSFAADSDNVVPTQQAIAEFLESKLSVGGQDVETNALQAGRVKLGTAENTANNIAGEYLRITQPVDFTGLDEFGNTSSVSGTFVSQQMLLQSYTDNMQ